MIDQLADFRRKLSVFLAIVLWSGVPAAAAAALSTGNGWLAPCLMAGFIAALGSAAILHDASSPTTRYLLTVCFIATISVAVAAARGGAMQIDLHMGYFAALAILAAYCDTVVILLAAGVIALHHLGLNFLAPALVFPDGANFLRVLLHAGIVVVESAALLWMAQSVQEQFSRSAQSLEEARLAMERAETANAAAASQREARDRDQAAAAAAQERAAKALHGVVNTLASALSGLSSGNLAKRLEDPFPADYERLRGDFNATVDALHSTIQALNGHALTVQNGAGEIARAAHDLSARTESQAASQEETTAALNEVTQALHQTAQDVARARDVAGAARKATEMSGTVVKDAVSAMAAIDVSSNKINQIIGVINEIAFQTNLLALNAGVEAARAGDAGRGFAVVATEVRALAQRTADAAREIRGLIGSSEKDVRSGVEHVNRTGEVLSELAAQVNEIDRLIGAVSETARQQTMALSQVNEALSDMDQVAQHNAAMVEETSAAAQEMLGSAEKLTELANHFTLETAPRQSNWELELQRA